MNWENAGKVAGIVGDSGGKVVGRTRLQKIAYLLDVAGYGEGFTFRYKHYGPFSEELASAARTSVLLGELRESSELATWGGMYSIYEVDQEKHVSGPAGRVELAGCAAAANAIVLELAATAVFLQQEGHDDPWEETKRRKPQKSEEGRLEQAKQLLETFNNIEVSNPLPCIS